jgi:hypothetical protein
VLVVKDLRARIGRLEELARGLAEEICTWKGADSPLLPLERKVYLNAVQDAIAGLDRAHEALAVGLRRIDDESRVRPSLVVDADF